MFVTFRLNFLPRNPKESASKYLEALHWSLFSVFLVLACGVQQGLVAAPFAEINSL